MLPYIAKERILSHMGKNMVTDIGKRLLILDYLGRLSMQVQVYLQERGRRSFDTDIKGEDRHRGKSDVKMRQRFGEMWPQAKKTPKCGS